MGGGDLNSKKSWHPNTIKNQERVWKAEQAAAEEKKRIMELQHERAVERDRAELNDLAKRCAGGPDNNDDRLHWMYNKPDKKGQAEDYLLGKSIEKGYDQPEKSDDVIPAVARRVVGSSMTTSTEDTQVDLARKMREDPLLLVKERERAARAALLNNPLHRKRIADLLRKEQEQQKSNKAKKSKKKDKDLDSMLAAKLNALSGEKGIDVAALLASDDSSSSSESSDDENVKKKKKKSVKKSKKAKKKNSSESDHCDGVQLQKKVRDRKDDYHKQKLHESTRKHHLSEKSGSKKSKKIRSDSRDSSDSDRNVNKGKKHEISKDKRHKNNYKNKKSYSSQNHDSEKDLRDERSNQGLEIPTRRKSRSESSDVGRGDKWRKENKSVGSRSSAYETQSRRRSTSCESERESNRKHGKGASVERSYQRESIKRRSRSLEFNYSKSSRDRKHDQDRRKRRSESRESGKEMTAKRIRRDSSEDKRERYNKSSQRRDHSRDRDSFKRIPEKNSQVGERAGKSKRVGMSEEERAARLAEMAAAGASREEERGARVARQRAAARAEEAAPRRPRAAPLAALPASLETRIHSNRHYIQRNQAHMNEHFARR